MKRVRIWLPALLAALALLAGCKKDTTGETAAAPSATPAGTHTMPDSSTMPNEHAMANEAGHEHAEHEHGEGMEPSGSTVALPADAANTLCPVMAGKPAKAQFHVEYEGKTYYFCCGMCPKKFQADPAKYIAKISELEPDRAKAAGG